LEYTDWPCWLIEPQVGPLAVVLESGGIEVGELVVVEDDVPHALTIKIRPEIIERLIIAILILFRVMFLPPSYLTVTG
jgi:hypothetical protein